MISRLSRPAPPSLAPSESSPVEESAWLDRPLTPEQEERWEQICSQRRTMPRPPLPPVDKKH